jgi:hypothetical protein
MSIRRGRAEDPPAAADEHAQPAAAGPAAAPADGEAEAPASDGTAGVPAADGAASVAAADGAAGGPAASDAAGDARIYSVATNSFSSAADPITGRDYHSGGILLPNGSVLTLGGNPLFGNKQDTTPETFNQEIDVYYPPYMFQGTRPRIQEAPTVMGPGHRYIISVSQPSQIRYLRLMRPDNPTHVTDVNARSIAVPFRRVGGNDLVVTIPSNARSSLRRGRGSRASSRARSVSWCGSSCTSR